MVEEDWSDHRLWFFPSEQRLWEEAGTTDEIHAVLKAHEDAIRVLHSGCPKCLVGYRDIMADPMFLCDLCHGTGFPVFTPKTAAEIQFEKEQHAAKEARWRENFQEGDVITFGNKDRPDWTEGKWRVKRVTAEGIELTPLKDDESVDAARDAARQYRIN